LAVFCERGNEHLCSSKAEKFLYQLSDYYFSRKTLRSEICRSCLYTHAIIY
jgi:hypothetical protein